MFDAYLVCAISNARPFYFCIQRHAYNLNCYLQNCLCFVSMIYDYRSWHEWSDKRRNEWRWSNRGCDVVYHFEKKVVLHESSEKIYVMISCILDKLGTCQRFEGGGGKRSFYDHKLIYFIYQFSAKIILQHYLFSKYVSSLYSSTKFLSQ